MTRSKLFISYSHKDVRWLDRVREQLAVLERERLIDIFEDTRIGAGEDWYAWLDREMLEARIALLLISAPFLTSAFIQKQEIPRLFGRHEENGMVLYPLLVRDCPWQEVLWLARLQIRPREARPIASMRGAMLDKCLADVAREIASIVKADDPPRKIINDTIRKNYGGSHLPEGVTELEQDVIGRLLTFLEDRRLLTDESYNSHFPDPLRKSAAEIRRRVNKALQEVGRNSKLTPFLKRIQTAAKRFQEVIEGEVDKELGYVRGTLKGHTSYTLLQYRQEMAEAMIQAAKLWNLEVDADIIRAYEQAQEILRPSN